MTTLQEILAAKAAMDAELQTAIGKVVEKFREETGLSPIEIHVFMVETTMMQDVTKQHHVGEVISVVTI